MLQSSPERLARILATILGIPAQQRQWPQPMPSIYHGGLCGETANVKGMHSSEQCLPSQLYRRYSRRFPLKQISTTIVDVDRLTNDSGPKWIQELSQPTMFRTMNEAKEGGIAST